MQQNLDRMRVDNVGSLLRPAALKAAVERHEAGELGDAELQQAQDQAIRDVVQEQEARGLPVLVDGEFRRASFMDSFATVAGYEALSANLWSAHKARELAPAAAGSVLAPSAASRTAATERLRLVRNQPRLEYEFAQGLTSLPVKTTLLGPDRVFQTFDAPGSREVYSDPWQFLDDVVAVEREMVAGLVAAGCRYVHLDAPGLTAYVDPASLERFRQRGFDPVQLMRRTVAAENAVIADFPGVTFGIHLCRGNEQSHWHREGSYDAIAEQLFHELAHQRLLLEYDTERAGTFDPLRFVPADATVVLGLITTKSPVVESVDTLRRRIDEAARFVPVERLAISPQCGFASTIEGNDLTESDQWRKFEVMLRTAELVWG